MHTINQSHDCFYPDVSHQNLYLALVLYYVEMISNKHRKMPENHTTILVSFTVEVELWCSTITVELRGRVQIIIGYGEFHFSTMSEHHHSLFYRLHFASRVCHRIALHASDFIPKAQFEKVIMPANIVKWGLKKCILQERFDGSPLQVSRYIC